MKPKEETIVRGGAKCRGEAKEDSPNLLAFPCLAPTFCPASYYRLSFGFNPRSPWGERHDYKQGI